MIITYYHLSISVAEILFLVWKCVVKYRTILLVKIYWRTLWPEN